MAKVEKNALPKNWLTGDIVKANGITEGIILNEPELQESEYGKKYVCKLGVGEEKYMCRINSTSLMNLIGKDEDFDMADLEGVSVLIRSETQTVNGTKREVIFLERK